MTRFLAVIGAATLATASLFFFVVLWFFYSMPDASRLKGCVITEMYRVHLCEDDSRFVNLNQISPYVIGAVVMSEDASFFSHDGIDVNEMKESFFKNINEGRYARGGSTITQQLAKNVFLKGEKSLTRKLQEIYLAIQIEKLFTKNKILTLYLNVVEFGPGIFGISRASEYYFHKPPSQLNPEEAAFLAFLLPNPKKYSESFRKKQLTPFAFKSVNNILHKMLMGKKIDNEEFRAAQSRVGSLFGGSRQAMPAQSEETGGDDDVFEDSKFNFEPEGSD